jgi:DEAD/DEAH box helicase domain-containing protein
MAVKNDSTTVVHCQVMETMELAMAMLKLYEGAVYLHEGGTYVVQECDADQHVAKVLRTDVNYYTEPRDHTRVTILGRTSAREARTGFRPASRGGKAGAAPTDCLIVLHGRAKVEKRIYGDRR